MIPPVATVARILRKLGIDGAELIEALAEVEGSCLAFRSAGDAGDVQRSYSVAPRQRTAHAEAQARYRDRQRAKKLGITGDHQGDGSDRSDVTVITGDKKPSPVITGDHSRGQTHMDSLPSSLGSTEKSVFVEPTSPRDHPSRVITFESWFAKYPDSEFMSEARAREEWQALTADDHFKADAVMPHFRAWRVKQAASYTLVHAHTFLREKRFERLFDKIVVPRATPPEQVFVKEGTPEWYAWMRERGGRLPVKNGGWMFPSRWPPGAEQQREIPLLRKIG